MNVDTIFFLAGIWYLQDEEVSIEALVMHLYTAATIMSGYVEKFRLIECLVSDS